jgi:hypothetical protein
MKIKFWLFTLLLFGIILVVEYDISRRTQARVSAFHHRQIASSSVAVIQPVANSTINHLPTNADTSSDNKSFDAQFKSASQEMARLQADPSTIETKLDQMAESLSDENVLSLQKIVSNSERPGDDRALAVELLSRKKTPESLLVLETFVKNHQTTTKSNWSRPQEFDSVITAQAIEGIASYPEKDKALTALHTLSRTVKETFLLDRIARSKESINGHAPSPDQQDDAALKKLIE